MLSVRVSDPRALELRTLGRGGENCQQEGIDLVKPQGADCTVCREFRTIVCARLPNNLAILPHLPHLRGGGEQDCQQACSNLRSKW